MVPAWEEDLPGKFLGRLPLLTLLSWEAFTDAPLTEAAASLIAAAASPLLPPLVFFNWAFRLGAEERTPPPLLFYGAAFTLVDAEVIGTRCTFYSSSASLPESILM